MEPTIIQQALSTSTFSPPSLPALLCSQFVLFAFSPSGDQQHPVSAPPSQTPNQRLTIAPLLQSFPLVPLSRVVVPNLFGTWKRFHGRQFFHGLAVEGIVSRWFMHITSIRHFKGSASNSADPGSVPGLGRSPREGNSNLLQYSCLGNPMERGAQWTIVHGIAKSRTQLSN